MGINSELARVDEAEAQSAIAGGRWPRPRMRDGERFRTVLNLDKSWGALQWLVAAAVCTVDPILGTPFGEDGDSDYAPPGYLDADAVRAAAAFLSRLDFEGLAEFVDEDAMDDDDVYPFGCDRDEAESFRGPYADLQQFYAAAAAADQWVLTILA